MSIALCSMMDFVVDFGCYVLPEWSSRRRTVIPKASLHVDLRLRAVQTLNMLLDVGNSDPATGHAPGTGGVCYCRRLEVRSTSSLV